MSMPGKGEQHHVRIRRRYRAVARFVAWEKPCSGRVPKALTGSTCNFDSSRCSLLFSLRTSIEVVEALSSGNGLTCCNGDVETCGWWGLMAPIADG
jgi:hypothetical protein